MMLKKEDNTLKNYCKRRLENKILLAKPPTKPFTIFPLVKKVNYI